MAIKTKVPVRTCVVCRRRAPQSELLRFVFAKAEVQVEGVAVSDVLEVDVEKIALGRGAYSHANKECLLKPGALMSIAFGIRKERRKKSQRSARGQEDVSGVICLLEKKLIELEQLTDGKFREGKKITVSKQKIEKRNLLRKLCESLASSPKAENVENNNREVKRKIRF
jgi:predicted RNA-binding protein YlxR (DUF448 family)